MLQRYLSLALATGLASAQSCTGPLTSCEKYELYFTSQSMIPLVNASMSNQTFISLALDISTGSSGFVSTTCTTPSNVACSAAPIYAAGAYNNSTQSQWLSNFNN